MKSSIPKCRDNLNLTVTPPPPPRPLNQFQILLVVIVASATTSFVLNDFNIGFSFVLLLLRSWLVLLLQRIISKDKASTSYVLIEFTKYALICSSHSYLLLGVSGQKPPGRKPPDKNPLDKKPPCQKPPGQKPPRQNL